ncbi:Blp family class II bacteriocin [Lactococcus lactis]|uniref:Blp family class II bacteriocin n=1 Tax=Lactococcus lactis TaxID=1358 RepID=UPI001CDC4DB7|nr:Blp family class II bacteriocin [Lactococcus lactis]MCA2382343.1 Blp family class II bacteriocin [Lactococcus sp. SK2-659]MDR7697110.1 Blp family class II bacteriocin [Lactococcus lactis]
MVTDEELENINGSGSIWGAIAGGAVKGAIAGSWTGNPVGIGMSALGGAVLGGVTYARPVH